MRDLVLFSWTSRSGKTWQKKKEKNYFNIPLEKRTTMMTLFRDAVFLLLSPSLQINIMLRHYQHAHVRYIIVLYRLCCRDKTAIQCFFDKSVPYQLLVFFDFIFLTGLGKLLSLSLHYLREYYTVYNCSVALIPEIVC